MGWFLASLGYHPQIRLNDDPVDMADLFREADEADAAFMDSVAKSEPAHL
jgi:hypothetical protein